MFKRWAVVYKHDQSPLDGGVFVHQAAAEAFKTLQSNAPKLEVKKFVLASLESLVETKPYEPNA